MGSASYLLREPSAAALFDDEIGRASEWSDITNRQRTPSVTVEEVEFLHRLLLGIFLVAA
jgi:hypothetical protein